MKICDKILKKFQTEIFEKMTPSINSREMDPEKFNYLLLIKIKLALDEVSLL